MSGLAEYGRSGLIGVLTPQANTTVEPEMWALLPPGWSMINARLTSEKPTIEERLVDYTGIFAKTATQFANAPVDVIAAACTGASYLIGREREAAIVGEVENSRNVPFLTAALASVAALRQIGARRIALLTPYPESLNAASAPYWESHGFEVVAKAGPALKEASFHPIYAMDGASVLAAYRALSTSDADAILMLGTGMATLQPLATGHAEGLKPAISCNLALAWAACQKRRWDALQESGLRDWMQGSHWFARLPALLAQEG
jgi:maleate cis-trans isomerase